MSKKEKNDNKSNKCPDLHGDFVEEYDISFPNIPGWSLTKEDNRKLTDIQKIYYYLC